MSYPNLMQTKIFKTKEQEDNIRKIVGWGDIEIIYVAIHLLC